MRMCFPNIMMFIAKGGRLSSMVLNMMLNMGLAHFGAGKMFCSWGRPLGAGRRGNGIVVGSM